MRDRGCIASASVRRRSSEVRLANTTALAAHPLGGHLIVTTSVLSAVAAVLATPAPAVERLRLAPHPTAPRAARNFVTRTLLDWGLGRVISSASLVVSELVTNSTMYAGTDIALSVAWHRGALRLAVRDNSSRLPRQVYSALDLHGRGLTIVAGLSRAFGVLPTTDGGKVVWAVLDASQPRTSAHESRINPASKGSPMVTAPNSLPQLARRRLPPVQPEGHDAFPQRGAYGHVAVQTGPRPARALAGARAVTTLRRGPDPYCDPSNYLG